MSKFNWSLLDRQGIANFVMLAAPLLIDKKMSIDTFHKILSSHLKNHIPIRTKKTKGDLVDSNSLWIGGTYYSDYDKEKKKCIEILFEYYRYDKTIQINKRNFRKVAYGIADTLLHEIIHMRQYRRRKFKIIPDYASTAEKTEIRKEQSYLGCTDEIDAYGFNIACELHNKFDGDYDRIVDYLNEQQKNKKRRSNCWRIYLKAFEHNHNHPILQRLKKKVVRYLPFADIGKPYRTKDWIDH